MMIQFQWENNKKGVLLFLDSNMLTYIVRKLSYVNHRF
jgi:hypothetical protein